MGLYDQFKMSYLIMRHMASKLERTISIIETYHGAIMAIANKIAMRLPKIQLRFC